MTESFVPYQAEACIQARSVLVLAAHPDDEVFGCGGSLCLHSREQVSIRTIVVTDGGYGYNNTTRTEIVKLRESESAAASKILGIPSPEFWRMPDRELVYSEALITRIISAIRQCNADLVYAPSPLEIHPDHCALSYAVIEAVRRIRQQVRIALYEISAPLRPNTLVDISPVIELKRAAIRCFDSQCALRPYEEQILALNRYRTYTLPSNVKAAEAFEIIMSEEVARDYLSFMSVCERMHAVGMVRAGPSSQPLVSVIVRSLYRSSLRKALDSIAIQTYSNIEVIVIDAGGEGQTLLPDYCGRFPMRLISKGRKLKRSEAANVGLDEAKGQLLIFLDDDDWFYPHHIAKLKQALDTDSKAVGAYSTVVGVDASGNEIHLFDNGFDPALLCVRNYMPIHAVLFRRKAIECGTRFDESLDLLEDWDFWLALVDKGHFIHVPELGAVYRMGGVEGSGVWEDAERVRHVMLSIYRKRLPLLSDNLLWSVMEYARYKELYQSLTKRYEEECSGHRAAIAMRDAAIAERDEAIAERDAAIAERDAAIAQRDTVVTERDEQLAAVYNSTSWRLTRPLRIVKEVLMRV